MNRMDFVQAVVRTRVLEKKLVSKEKLEELIEAAGIDEVWGRLKTTHYANKLSEATNPHRYENILSKELKEVYSTMRDISPEPDIINLTALKYDYHNLKVLCKEIILQTDFPHIYSPIGSLDMAKIKMALKEKKWNEIEPAVKSAIEKVQDDYKRTKDSQRVDIILDQLYMNNLYKCVDSLQISLFLEYVKAMIDFINIRTLIRVQKQKKKEISFLEDVLLENGNVERERILYSLHDSVTNIIHRFRNEKISSALIPGLEGYQSSKQLTEFEKEMDRYLLGLMRQSKYIHFGPEPLLFYILAKEMEIKNLRMIFTSKLNDIPLERIKRRVREVYV